MSLPKTLRRPSRLTESICACQKCGLRACRALMVKLHGFRGLVCVKCGEEAIQEYVNLLSRESFS